MALGMRMSLATEDTLRQVFAGVDDFPGIVHSGVLGRRALRRLWRCAKKQTSRGETAEINVASLCRLKPTQTDLIFSVEVADGLLSTGEDMHATGMITGTMLANLDPVDRHTAQRWGWDSADSLELPDVSSFTVDDDGHEKKAAVLLSHLRAGHTRISFDRLLVTRHVTNVRLDKHTDYCDACLRAAPHLLTCGRCQVAAFCSVECQRAAWPAHKAWCKAAAALPEGDKDTHAIVPSGKFELEHTLRLNKDDKTALQKRQMQRHAQIIEIRNMVGRGLLPAMTPAQMERLRRYLASTRGVLPESEKDLDAILGPAVVESLTPAPRDL